MVQIFMNLFCLYLDDGEESLHDHEDGNGCKDNLREQDIYLPIANVARIMKNAIPQTGKVCHPFTCTNYHKLWMICRFFFWIIINVILLIDCQRCKGVRTGVCERVYQLHHFRSQRAMSSGEAQDHQRRRYPVCHVHTGFWYVRGAAQTLPAEVQRGRVSHTHTNVSTCFFNVSLRDVMFSRQWRVRRVFREWQSQKAWVKNLQKTVSVSIS